MGKGKGYRIGMSKPIVAKYAYDAASKKVSYSNAIYLGEAMTGTFTPNYAEASLYGDDHEVDSSKELTDVTISLGVTKLPINAHSVLFGATVDGSRVSEKTTDTADYVGIGFISRQSNNRYTAVVYPKAKFANGAETFNTKSKSVSYSTPTLNGTAVGSDKDDEVRCFAEDLTEEKALEYVIEILGNPDAEQNQTNNTQNPDNNTQNSDVTQDPEESEME